MAIQNLYVGDGVTVLYSFTFPYIDTTDVKVSLDGTDTTEYSLANATTIEFVTAPANGVDIRIYRRTTFDAPKGTFYPGSAIRAQDLNDNFEQNLFVVQEAAFDNSQSASDSAEALATANAADAKADQANIQSAAAEASAAQAAADAAAAQAVQIGFTPIYNIPGDDQSGIKYLDSTFPIDTGGGVTLPDENTAWEENGAIRYNDSINKIELYEATEGRWVTAAGGADVSNTPPTPASEGDVWWDNTDGRSYVYYVDADSAQWVEMNPAWNGTIPDNSIDSAKLVTDAVTTPKIVDAAVTTPKIVDAAVTPAKLDRAYVEKAGDTMTGNLTAPVVIATSHVEGVGEHQQADFGAGEYEFTVPTWATGVKIILRQGQSNGADGFPFIMKIKRGTGANTGTATGHCTIVSWAGSGSVNTFPDSPTSVPYLRLYTPYAATGPGTFFTSRGIGEIHWTEVNPSLYRVTGTWQGASFRDNNVTSNAITYWGTTSGNMERPAVLSFQTTFTGGANTVELVFYAN